MARRKRSDSVSRIGSSIASTNVLARPNSGGMLPAPADDHARQRAAVLEERAVGELLLAAARNQVLDHHLAGADVRRRRASNSCRSSSRVFARQALAFGRVDEVLLDRRLDRERAVHRNLIQLRRRCSRTRCAASGCRARLGQPIGVPLVPDPLHRVPLRRRHAELLGELGAVAGERGHGFVPRRIQHPAVETEPPADRRSTMSTVWRSSRSDAVLTACVVYRENRAIDCSSSMTHTGTPCRPRLRTIPRPW